MSERLNVRRVGLKNSWKKGEDHPKFGDAWYKDSRGRELRGDIELHEHNNGWLYIVHYVLKTFKDGDELFEKRVKKGQTLYDNSSTKDEHEIDPVEDGENPVDNAQPKKASPKKKQAKPKQEKPVEPKEAPAEDKVDPVDNAPDEPVDQP